jgi:GNAT superfamily N-acetyltransferase
VLFCYAKAVTETAPSEKAPTSLVEFTSLVAENNGNLIPLERKTEQGKSLFITSRYIGNPALEESPYAETGFYGWRDDKGLGAETGVLIIDVYAEKDDGIAPIGHMDWWLQGDYANGGGNMHAAAIPRNEIEERARDVWGGRHNLNRDNTAFKILPEYQRQKIGSLMLATSSVALKAVGVTKFYSGGLLDPAVNTYARFGIAPSDFDYNRDSRSVERWKTTQLPIERLSDNPHVNEIIELFLQSDSDEEGQRAA